MHGYMGRLLRIDLTSQKADTEPVTEELARRFLGGVGFAFKYLYDEFKPGTDPLDKTNKLIFAVGPLNATGAPCSNRMAVVSKSPLTGTIAASYAGGFFPSELKKAGYDMVIIEGRAESRYTSSLRMTKSASETPVNSAACRPPIPNFYQG
jgi:aldehyde:ferredoxin oxidoreductase